MRHKFLVVVLTGLVIYSTIPIGKVMGVSLIPRDDQSEYEISLTTPEGYSLERTSQVTAELESRIWKLKGTEHVFTTIGQTQGGRVVKGEGDVTRGTIYVRITDLEKRHSAVPVKGWWDVAGHVRRFLKGAEFDQFQIQQEARKFLEDYPDLRVSVNDVSPFQGGARPQTFQVSLAGPELGQLAAFGDQLIAKLKEAGSIVDLDTTLSLRKPEVQVVIDREAASDLGVPVGTIADTLRVLVGGLPVSKFRDGGEQYDVWLRADSGKRSTSQDLYQITLPSTAVGLVKLASLAKLNEDRGPTSIERLGRERIVTVLGNPEGIALGDAITQAERILKEMNLPPQYSYSFTGQAKTLGETGYYFMVAFTLSITFMYLILAAQFESWMQPIAILMALPVTIPFGMLSLVLFHTPMDLYAMFGLFMLVGIVKKNGILAGRRHQPAPGQGRIAARRDHGGQPHAAAADSDDNRDAGGGHGADRAGHRARGGCSRQHGQGDHRRPGALARAGLAGHAGLLRHSRQLCRLHPAHRHPLFGRAAAPAFA